MKGRAKLYLFIEEKILKKNYVLFSLLVGFLCGVFALLFLFLLKFITWLVLEEIVRYIQPRPIGEGGNSEAYTLIFERPYLLPLVIGLGGLVSGFLTYFFAPEAAGVGTDSAIYAFHHRKKLSLKSSIIKLITSAITIGTGGVSGREGPIALIGAGIGGFVVETFKLGEKERKLFLAIGLGAGIAAIFKAPLAGALISGEVFFKRDIDIEVIILSFIACVTSYVTVCMILGFQPIFSAQIPAFIRIEELVFYIGLGLFCAFVVRIFVFTFFKIQGVFNKLKIPFYFKPLLGGIFSGIVGAFIPVAIGNAYGWLQLMMDGKVIDPLFIGLSIIGVILAVSFTLGSGGSGGVFGPSVVIGGLVGALYSIVLNKLFNLNLHTPSFMIVGMVSLFAGAAKAPLSTLILVAEMTGGYALLFPAMLSIFPACFLSGEKSIFPSQVNTRLDSPAYRDEYKTYILEKLKVKEYMKNPITISPEKTLKEALEVMTKNLIGGLPVVKEGKLIGIITKSDIMSCEEEVRNIKKVEEVMQRKVFTVTEEDTLLQALELMVNKGVGRLPVVKKGSNQLIGIIARADIGRALRENY